MKVTSAYANKLIRKLNEDKEFWRNKERYSSTYTAAITETPVIPDYDYAQVAQNIADIDARILVIKHALNVNNALNPVSVGDKTMTVDMILIRMAQLNNRKEILDAMRKTEPKSRVGSAVYNKNAVIEYEYVNYDPDLVKADYEAVDSEIEQLQLALDRYNQTVEFEI